ncbi:MAG: SIR2 family protein [Erysipelotrichaceae bacterium]|nr:SIR2 family protein [Erysipelotrichaceae bacterium]
MKKTLISIHEKLKHEKLVIFVGAGVSKNSNVPTWGQIVRKYAQKLNYTKDVLSTDDYLKIPQYFYSYDQSKHHKEYYNILNEAFNQDFKPNILNDLIASFNAQHIITTNYDHLLDNYNYEVIKNDSDLLKATSSHYLIKMHGDIDDITQIIFKEDDYLSYSQTHSLMELFIKSLLIDHTFLFVGYSLNDYNLKTFLNWIDYLGRQNNVKEHMHSHYLITTDILPSQDYLNSYYSEKNIQVINLNLMDDHLLEEARHIPLEDEIGQKTYICLKYIKER